MSGPSSSPHPTPRSRVCTPYLVLLGLILAACTAVAPQGKRAYLRTVGFFSRSQPEAAGYGAYTYVLLPVRTTKGAALLQALLRRTDAHGELPPARQRRAFNVFYIPVEDGWIGDAYLQASEVARSVVDNPQDTALVMLGKYDVSLAREILREACGASRASDPLKSCENDGPYLATFSQPRWAEKPTDVRVIDMSSYSLESYGRVIRNLTDPQDIPGLNIAILDALSWAEKAVPQDK